MTPEEKSLLERTHKLAEDNNSILRSLRRSNRYATLFRVIYWIVIIALSFGAYYFIQPYVSNVMSLYDQVQGNVGAVQGASNDIKSLFK